MWGSATRLLVTATRLLVTATRLLVTATRLLVAATRLPVAATRLPVAATRLTVVFLSLPHSLAPPLSPPRPLSRLALARTLPLAATGADLARALSRALCSPLWAQQQRDTTSSSAYEVIKELDLQLEASQVQGLVLGVGGCWGLRVKV
jgi:hypothetical protein